MIVSETYEVQDCIRYSPTDYVNVQPILNWDLPSRFKLSFIINSDSAQGSTGLTNASYLRFNSSNGVWCGKGQSTNRNISFNGVTLHQIPVSTDTEYTLEYDNGNCTFSSGEDSITTTVSLTKIYSLYALDQGHAHLKSIKIKPL